MWEYRSVSLWLFVLVCSLSALGLLLTLFFLVFNVRFRKLRLVRMSSPNLNVLIALGGLLSYSCCTLFAASSLLGYDVTRATVVCQVRSWLLTLAVTLVFGTMLAKSWRVHRIFRAAGAHRVVIKDEKLVAIVAMLICADVIILSFWHGLDPLKAQIVPVGFWERQFSGYFNLTPVSAIGCSCANIPVWLSILFLYKASLLTVGLYLSWSTRNVALPAMNESKYTIMGTFITIVIGSISAALSVILRSYPDVVCACLAGAVWVSATVSLMLVFVPKIILVMKKKHTEIIRQSMKLTPSSDAPSASPDDDMSVLMAENRLLKKSLTEKDSAIQSLQKLLDSARAKLEQMTEEAEVKNDSGLDFDVSSATSSQEEEGGGKQIQVKPRQNTEIVNLSVVSETPPRSNKHIICKAQRSESMYSLRTSQKAKRSHSQSGGSVRSERIRSRIVALRDSIAEDLQHAHSFSSNLRDSIFKDLDQVTCHEVKQTPGTISGLMCAGSRKGLAGSIAESYNFGRGGDDWAYIHHFLQVSLPPKPDCMDSQGSPGRHWGPGTRPIPEGCSVIASDQLYPDSPRGDQVKPLDTRSKRRSRDFSKNLNPKSVVSSVRKGKKRDTVYVIQNPQAKHMVASCIAQKKCLQTANGTFNFEVLDSFV